MHILICSPKGVNFIPNKCLRLGHVFQVADYWLTKTPSLPTASGAPRFADQIISLGGLLASESNRFFKDLGVKPVSAAVVKRLHEKHGGCRETKFQKYMGDKPPDWISEAIKMRQQSKAYWSDIDNDMEVICLPSWCLYC